MNTSLSDSDFENEVRRIARVKWPSAKYSGAAMLEGRERDGIFETEESIHFVEATVSAGAGKAREDTKKLFKAISNHNRIITLKIAIGWFVTKNEPTADQRKEVQEQGKGQVKAVSFSQFQQSLVDVRGYLAARKTHFFGSVQSFSVGSRNPDIDFVEIGVQSISQGRAFSLSDLVGGVLSGGHFAITGQYGAGKSMTLREIFLRLEGRYIKGGNSQFPVYINLREHSGQRDPVELLERHARNIGFDSPSSLIRAWRGGFVVLLIDGFDEIASLGVQGSWKKLRDLRMRALEGVRRLIRESTQCGVLVAGRVHYFEDDLELCQALGLSNATTLVIDEFDSEQVKAFLAKFPSITNGRQLPDWLPTRPLLLGYLAARGLLTEIGDGAEELDAVEGWDYLLSRIYPREQDIETNLDGATLRRILERIASIARVSQDGLGPVTRKDLFAAFTEVCGYEPDEQGMLAIQRLPGLGIYRAEDESRCFVDKELADVCAGAEFSAFLQNPFESVKRQLWLDAMNGCDRPLGPTGTELADRRLNDSGQRRGLISQAITFLNARTDLECVKGDVCRVLIESNSAPDSKLSVVGLDFTTHDIRFLDDAVDLSGITFSNCLFEGIEIGSSLDAKHLPHFKSCLIERIAGRVSLDDLPFERFSKDCEVAGFDSTSTSGAIRSAQMSTGEKVLLITLRKLFIQSLSGRSESALYRGLDINERRYVPDVLRLLARHELAREYSRGDGVVWMPTRKALARVKRLIAAPNECGEVAVTEARELQ